MIYTYDEYRNVNPNHFKPSDMVAVKIVAVVGYGNTYAAYAGPASWPDEKVACEGNKISQTAGEMLFPSIAALHRWNP